MKRYQHRFESVQDYLHHRAPYLLVDRILELDSDRVVTETTVRGDSFYGQGHFPGTVVLPGALMQEMTTQSAGILIAAEHNPMPEYDTHDPWFNSHALGVLVKVDRARFRSFARPDDVLQTEVRLTEIAGELMEFLGSVRRDQTVLMSNRFCLTNIPSATLQGDPSAR